MSLIFELTTICLKFDVIDYWRGETYVKRGFASCRTIGQTQKDFNQLLTQRIEKWEGALHTTHNQNHCVNRNLA